MNIASKNNLNILALAMTLFYSLNAVEIVGIKGGHGLLQLKNEKLLTVVNEGNAQEVLQSIKDQADPSFKDSTGTPVLVLAIKEAVMQGKMNYADVAKILIEHGADVNATDKSGYNALDTLYMRNVGSRMYQQEKAYDQIVKELEPLLTDKNAKHSEKWLDEQKNPKVKPS